MLSNLELYEPPEQCIHIKKKGNFGQFSTILSQYPSSRDSAVYFVGAPAFPGSALRKSECIKSRPRTTKRRPAYRQSFSFRMQLPAKGVRRADR